jgi:hypothetical protein
MSIKVDMTSTDIDRQIELLRYYPEVVEKHFRPVLTVDIGLLADDIRPQIPVAKGKAAATFKKNITGKGIDLQAQVGWWGKNTAWYINIVEYGAKPHNINSFAPGAGVYIKDHPGFPAREFMANSFAAFQPVIEADMAIASENVVNDMVVR